VRADRLVAVLLLLQQRGQVTAAEVADELEISERTARRDLEALGMAGVPVYSQPGRGGGWRLAGGGRIDLSGLNQDEARALFMVAGPRADATPEVRRALRKLVRALPESLRSGAEAAAGAVLLDPSGWDRPEPWQPPLLDVVRAAVVDGECLRIEYEGRSGASTERVVHPLGVASKGRSWYLVTDTASGSRTFRVDRIRSAERTGEPVQRPEGFDLATAWPRIVEGIDAMRAPIRVRGAARPAVLGHLRATFGNRFTQLTPGEQPASDDWMDVEIRAHSIMTVAVELAGFGATVRVDEPPALRAELARIGEELTATYGARTRP
jgi:predicted DNA-binding transcriptional regulator YafY